MIVLADELIKPAAIPDTIVSLLRYSGGYFEVNMKKCIKCKEEKELSCFSKHKVTKDGFRSTCRNCANIYMKNHRKKPEFIANERSYAKKYLSQQKVKDHIKARSKVYNSRPEVKTRVSAYMKEQYLNPEARFKHDARKLVRMAIAKGTLKRSPCTICGTSENVQMHHEDYSKPLDVVALCRKHHAERHVEINKQKEGN